LFTEEPPVTKWKIMFRGQAPYRSLFYFIFSTLCKDKDAFPDGSDSVITVFS